MGWRLRLILGVRRRRSRGTFRRTCWFVRPRPGASDRRIPGRHSSGVRLVGFVGMLTSSLARLVPSWFSPRLRLILCGVVRGSAKGLCRSGGEIGKRLLPICSLGAPCRRLEASDVGHPFFHRDSCGEVVHHVPTPRSDAPLLDGAGPRLRGISRSARRRTSLCPRDRGGCAQDSQSPPPG